MFKWITHPTQGPYASVLMTCDPYLPEEEMRFPNPLARLCWGERIDGARLPKSAYLHRKRKLPDFFSGQGWMCSARGREVLEAFEPDHLSFHEIALRQSKRGAAIEGPYYLLGIHEPVEMIDFGRSEGYRPSQNPNTPRHFLGGARNLTAIRPDLIEGRHLVRDPRWRRGDWILASDEIIAALRKAKIRGWTTSEDMHPVVVV